MWIASGAAVKFCFNDWRQYCSTHKFVGRCAWSSYILRALVSGRVGRFNFGISRSKFCLLELVLIFALTLLVPFLLVLLGKILNTRWFSKTPGKKSPKDPWIVNYDWYTSQRLQNLQVSFVSSIWIMQQIVPSRIVSSIWIIQQTSTSSNLLQLNKSIFGLHCTL